MLYEVFGQFLFSVVNDIVNALEMVNSLHHIVHIDCSVCNPDGVGFKDVARLVVSQFAAFNMIGIVGQVNLSAMIDASFQSAALLFSQSAE